MINNFKMFTESLNTPNILKKGMLIEALKDLKGVTNSYSNPSKIDIPKGTVLRIPSQGTRRGDVFCEIVKGETKPKTNNVGLKEGHSTRGPNDLGTIDTTSWKIIEE